MDKVFYLLFWIILFPFMTQAKFKSLHCQLAKDGKDYGTIRVCKIKAISRTKNLINIIIDVHKTIGNGMQIQVQIFKRANGWRPFLYDFKVDACKFLKKPYHIIGALAFAYLRPFTNFNHTCPFEAGSSIIVKDFDLDVDNLRSRFPFENGEYALAFSIFLKKMFIGSINGSIYHFDYKEQ